MFLLRGDNQDRTPRAGAMVAKRRRRSTKTAPKESGEYVDFLTMKPGRLSVTYHKKRFTKESKLVIESYHRALRSAGSSVAEDTGMLTTDPQGWREQLQKFMQPGVSRRAASEAVRAECVAFDAARRETPGCMNF